MPRFRHVVLGGTFDRFHVGHEALLATAFRNGQKVSIGVTSDRFLAGHPKPAAGAIQPFSTRARALRRWIGRRCPGRIGRIVPIDDDIGGADAEDVDALVVSTETLPGGRAVNARRRRLGRRSVTLLIVPLVLADDLLPVSSRRIRSGEIDARGRRRAPLSVGVGVEDERDRGPAANALLRAFPRSTVRFVVPGRRSVGSAGLRARLLARAALRDHDLAVGIARTTIPRGWALVERSRSVVIDPRVVPARGPSALERGLRTLVRPPARAKRL